MPLTVTEKDCDVPPSAVALAGSVTIEGATGVAETLTTLGVLAVEPAAFVATRR